MTAKRFTYNVNKNTIEQDGKFVAYVNCVDGFRIANKLTVLAEENEQLKQKINDLRIGVLDSIHEADEIQCTCNPCIVEEYVKRVVE